MNSRKVVVLETRDTVLIPAGKAEKEDARSGAGDQTLRSTIASRTSVVAARASHCTSALCASFARLP